MNDRFDLHLHVTPTLFIGKWMVRILLLLEERPYRRGKLRRRLGTISQRMLTRTLRNLESSGLISRKITRLPKGGRMKSPIGPGRGSSMVHQGVATAGHGCLSPSGYRVALTQLSSSMTPALWQEVELPPNPALPMPNTRKTTSSALECAGSRWEE